MIKVNLDNEEPIQSVALNAQVSTTGHPLPEQAKTSFPLFMPRQVSIMSWINQWQPMGIRVVINLPFTGDDTSYLFAIRNGPFIPQWYKESRSVAWGYPSLSQRYIQTVQWAWNNTFPVRLVADGSEIEYPQKPSIYLTHYDMPPMLSNLATCFRRWRGDMQYRIRTVAGFITQGYVIIGSIKNVPSTINLLDEYSVPPWFLDQDNSYRETMQNAYILSDTSMIRHVETTMQFEYPVPYYDQYAWMAKRVNPTWAFSESGTLPFKYNYTGFQTATEPHADNWIVVGLRGNLATGQQGSQIGFELEYRAVEGFQFADPGFPPSDIMRSLWDMRWQVSGFRSDTIKGIDIQSAEVKRIPDRTWRSNGVNVIDKTPESQEQTTTTMPAVEKLRLESWTTRAPPSEDVVGHVKRHKHVVRGSAASTVKTPATWLGQSSRSG